MGDPQVNWTKWAVVVAVAVPLLWLMASGAVAEAGAWLITVLVAAWGVRAVLRAQRL